MKNLKKICQASILALSLIFTANESIAQQPIPTHYFGENAWMPDTIGSTFYNGKLHQVWQDVKTSNASMVRYGGIAVDYDVPTKFQYIRMIDSIRANGMEPIIQVPFGKFQSTAQQAADIVTYINVTKGKNIKYWIIANEPDLKYGYTTAAQIAAYYKPFASAMKAVDPSILLIGPEIASYNQSIINGLTTPGGPSDITGKDAAGRYYLDVISFHTYPFNGSQDRNAVVTKLTSTNGLQDNLIHLNGRVASCNSFHNRTGAAKLKTAITEANIGWKNPAGDNINGLGVNSFIGGQFVAEMMCIGLKNNLDFINIWSIIEGNNTEANIGYIDHSTKKKKPMFYHFKMLAQNFKGNYIDGITNKPNVKSFGSQNSQEISVLVMNQELSGSYNCKIRLNATAIAGTTALKVNVDAGINVEYDEVIESQSTVLFTFNSAGTLIRKTEYTITNAIANQPPTVTELLTTGVGETTVQDNGPFEIKNVFPNPTAGKFTVEMNKANGSEKEFNVQIFNIIGQEVYNKNSTFINGKEVVELEPSIASGEYIVRIKEQDKDNYLVRKIMLQK
ncbi:MAG: T9SS type A sorting domain-containing protein [Bacteroidota bacterium]